MAIAGALIGGAIGAFGKKPKIPALPPIDPTQVQRETIEGNLAALPGIERLGSQVNRFNAQEMLASLERFLPGGLGLAQSNITSQLRGELPGDVTRAVTAATAAQGFAGGFAGSGLGRNLTLRDLGLTSLQIQQQGLTNFEQLSSFARAPMFDPTAMFFSPQQRLQFALADRGQRFERDLLTAQVRAAPDPATAALGREIDRFFNTVASYGMMAAGAATPGAGAAGSGAANAAVSTNQAQIGSSAIGGMF